MLFIPVAFLLLLSRMVRLRKWMLAAEVLLVVAALFHYTWMEYAPSDPLEKKRVELFSRMSDKVARLHAPRILYFDNPAGALLHQIWQRRICLSERHTRLWRYDCVVRADYVRK